MFSIKGLLYFNTQHSVCSCCTVQFLAQFTIRLCATATDKISRSEFVSLSFSPLFLCISLSVSIAKQCGSYYRRLSVKFAVIRAIRPQLSADWEKLSLRPLTRPWIHYRVVSVFGFIFHSVLSCLVGECTTLVSCSDGGTGFYLASLNKREQLM